MTLKLVQYRDPEQLDYIYFWVNNDNIQVSPVFYNEGTALDWKSHSKTRCPWDNWKANKDIR